MILVRELAEISWARLGSTTKKLFAPEEFMCFLAFLWAPLAHNTWAWGCVGVRVRVRYRDTSLHLISRGRPPPTGSPIGPLAVVPRCLALPIKLGGDFFWNDWILRIRWPLKTNNRYNLFQIITLCHLVRVMFVETKTVNKCRFY